MRKIIFAVAFIIVVLTSCFHTNSETSIQKDGSGVIVTNIDLSMAMSGLLGDKKGPEKGYKNKINLSDYFSKVPALTEDQKSILKSSLLEIDLSGSSKDDIKFIVTISTDFKKITDLNPLFETFRSAEFNKLVDVTMDNTVFAGTDSDAGNDDKDPDGPSIYATIWPSFLKSDYTAGSIKSTFDKKQHQLVVDEMKANELDINGQMEKAMFGEAKFTNVLVLPNPPKTIEGKSWKKTSEANKIVQEGSLLSLYSNPADYEFSITY